MYKREKENKFRSIQKDTSFSKLKWYKGKEKIKQCRHHLSQAIKAKKKI